MARPRVTLKLATSLDGKIALANGDSQWITGEAARAAGRALRASHDAICVGANTAHLDNPQLTARISGKPDPVRVIFDSRARLSPKSNLAQSARQVPVVLFCNEGAQDKAEPLTDLGVTVLPIGVNGRGLDIEAALQILHRRGIESLLVEGGGQLAASFVTLGAVDRIEWFRAPMILGSDGRDAIGSVGGPLGLETMDKAYRFTRVNLAEIGDDIHESYERVAR